MAGALAANTDVILVVSWNEFIENSHIEPSNLYGTQSLDTLRPLISAWKGEHPRSSVDAPTSYVIRSSQNASVYAVPRQDAQVIGTLAPDVNYTLLGEENGMYQVDFGGREGYVLALNITLVPSTTPGDNLCLILRCPLIPA